LSPFFIIQN
jgi:hypothetical protein